MGTNDEEDFTSYVTGRLPALRRVAAQLTGDPHRGDDLVQQAITRLYTHWRRASRTEHLDAYVYKIMLRVYLDERRLRWAGVRLGVDSAELDRAMAAPDVEERMLLRDALATLPVRQRAVVVLRFIADRSVDDVAEILGISPGTVKSQTHDGLGALRRLLGQPADNEGRPA